MQPPVLIEGDGQRRLFCDLLRRENSCVRESELPREEASSSVKHGSDCPKALVRKASITAISASSCSHYYGKAGGREGGGRPKKDTVHRVEVWRQKRTQRTLPYSGSRVSRIMLRTYTHTHTLAPLQFSQYDFSGVNMAYTFKQHATRCGSPILAGSYTRREKNTDSETNNLL